GDRPLRPRPLVAGADGARPPDRHGRGHGTVGLPRGGRCARESWDDARDGVLDPPPRARRRRAGGTLGPPAGGGARRPPPGRAAALLLADLAAERGDTDAALGWLERVEDVEEVAADDLAGEVSRWREARLSREAVALASTRDAVPRVKAWLFAPASPRPAPADL